jgi:hypothetical protein
VDPAVLAVLLTVASLTVLVGGGGAVCSRLLESTRRGRLRTWIAVAVQFLFGVASLVAVLVPTMLVWQHYDRLIAANAAANETLERFESLINADLVVAVTATAAAIGTLLWSAYQRGHPRRVRRTARRPPRAP